MEGCAEWSDSVPSLPGYDARSRARAHLHCQVDHRSTWKRLNQRFQGRKLAVGVHHCDVETTLEIILINLLESLEYLRHRAVREVIDGCERDIAAKRQE
jgi:hypothetical protein